MVLWEALDALSHQFELCKIEATSRVIVVLDETCTAERSAIIRAALTRSGAQAVEVRSLGGAASVDDHSLLADMIATADVLITTDTPTFDMLKGQLTNSQQLLHLAPIDPHAFAPHASLRRRARTLVEQIRSGSELLLEDSYGSSLRIDLARSNSAFDHGILGPERDIACFPAGWVSATPAVGAVNGQLVLMPGDANLEAARLVSSPVRMTILDDHVSQIQGTSADADVVRALFEYAGDPNAYGIAEVSVGMNPSAQTGGVFDERLLDPVLSRLLAGVVTLSFGHNLLADRPCAQTITLALPGRSLAVDDLPITLGGQLQGDFAPDVYEL